MRQCDRQTHGQQENGQENLQGGFWERLINSNRFPDYQERVKAQDVHQERPEGRPGQNQEGGEGHRHIRRRRHTHRGEKGLQVHRNDCSR